MVIVFQIGKDEKGPSSGTPARTTSQLDQQGRKKWSSSLRPVRTRKGHRQSDQQGREMVIIIQTARTREGPSSVRPARTRKGRQTSKDEKGSSSVRPVRMRKVHRQTDQQGRERSIVRQTSKDGKWSSSIRPTLELF